jgi:hypothetical protein
MNEVVVITENKRYGKGKNNNEELPERSRSKSIDYKYKDPNY